MNVLYRKRYKYANAEEIVTEFCDSKLLLNYFDLKMYTRNKHVNYDRDVEYKKMVR